MPKTKLGYSILGICIITYKTEWLIDVHLHEWLERSLEKWVTQCLLSVNKSEILTSVLKLLRAIVVQHSFFSCFEDLFGEGLLIPSENRMWTFLEIPEKIIVTVQVNHLFLGSIYKETELSFLFRVIKIKKIIKAPVWSKMLYRFLFFKNADYDLQLANCPISVGLKKRVERCKLERNLLPGINRSRRVYYNNIMSLRGHQGYVRYC